MSGEIRPRNGCTRQPVERVSNGGSAASTSTSSGPSPTSSSASRSAVASRSASSGSGFPPGQPELPAVQAAVVRAHDDRDAELAVRIAEDRDEDGGVP